MNKGHQIKIYPTKRQINLFNKSCGVARFSYNWALNRWNEKYKSGEKIKRNELRKELTDLKRSEFPWMLEVSKNCPQYAIANLENAFNRFFKTKTRYPKFKKRGVKDSFVAIENNAQWRNCGDKKESLKLSERTYNCEKCGLEIDRDLNAAINLANYKPYLQAEGSKACGEGSSVAEMQHSPSMNQESSNLITIKI